MFRTTSRTALAALAAVAFTATTAAAATIPTYKEFKAATFQDADGTYIVNGDEPVDSNGELHQFYDSLVGSSTPTDSLVVNRVNGRDDVWSATQVANLTYCVSDRFGKDKADVVNAMAQGTALWEGASSRINYAYVSSQDGSCTTRNSSVVFSVEPTKTTQYIARAFFPSTSKSGRNILVNARSLMSSGSWTPGNIMGHELGHTLGLRHEHTRPEAGTCFEDNNWRALTPYDSASIMHYPQCNGSSSDLSMTNEDRQGIQALYGN
ncbi:M57 family metalloprotease [Ornithinimicrobium tianjinense]|uniref:Peptidase metallopeptidase domain-containing protein n=1 Tax=Ornithinimicrobium tianjinense TaxID=1195761 RepID=A0A917BC31_9MICO|nr:M57 family metalloprotease [Ornithinimicrobium tianjinense]GGF36744.1 hypothetical protein GCM10011366_00460 [Ornithinimicrobium tianjinense]